MTPRDEKFIREMAEEVVEHGRLLTSDERAIGGQRLLSVHSAGMLRYARAHTGSRYRERLETLAGLRAVEAAVRADQIEKFEQLVTKVCRDDMSDYYGEVRERLIEAVRAHAGDQS